MKIRKFITDNRLCFAAFLMPALILVLAFISVGIYPFGNQQIAVIDMYHQYVPFLAELQDKLTSAGSLMYSWDGAAGHNFWSLLAYYTASPLNLLLILIPQKHIMEGVTLLLVIKVGLAGSFMFIFLKGIVLEEENSARKAGWDTVAFASLYALCGFVLGYYWNIMWMDAVMLLPLLVMGLCRLVNGRGAVLYTVVLALIIFINYYIAIPVCIFIILFLPVLHFSRERGASFKTFAAAAGRVAGYSVIGAAMAGVILVPTYLAMQSASATSGNSLPDSWFFYNDPLSIINQLLPNASVTSLEGLPNLYCGLIVVMMLVFYVLSHSISMREKLLHGAFLVVMFLTLNVNVLDFIMHGCHYPNQIPHRYTFAICFVLIWMAYKTFLRIDEVKVNHIWAALGGGLAYYLIAQKLLKEGLDNATTFFYTGAVLLVLYSAVLALYRKGVFKSRAFQIAIAVVIAAELCCTTVISVGKVGSTDRAEYMANYDDVKTLAQTLEDDFERVEIDDATIANFPMLYHYKGVSQFSSSLNTDCEKFMEKVGMEAEKNNNRIEYIMTAPVFNSMMGVNYIITRNQAMKNSDYTLEDRSGNSRLYRSKYPLSVGYMTAQTMQTWKTEDGNPFLVLNDYVRAATDNKVESVFNLLESDGKKIKGKTTTISYVSSEKQRYFLFVETTDAEAINVKHKKAIDNQSIVVDMGSIIDIGEMKAGEEFSVDIDYKKENRTDYTCYVYSMDYDAWDKAYAMLADEQLKVKDYSDTSISGTIKAGKDGVFVMSVPYEKGWTLKVDGVMTAISDPAGGELIATRLEAGTHEIEISYRTPGLVAGAVLSLAGILLLIMLVRIRRDS